MIQHLQVPLGVLPHNENSTEGMVNILEEMSEYLPEIQVGNGDTSVFPLAMGGDMLTCARARARTAQDVRITSCGKKALRGLYPFPGDWHAKVNFMEVSSFNIYNIYISCMHNIY